MRTLLISALLIFAASARAQESNQPTFSTTVATFGMTVVVPGGLTGRIYLLDEGTRSLPNFEKFRREPVGTIYTRQLWVPPREFSEGFPGITNRFEWFAIDYAGRFYVSAPGAYRFSIESDDGSKLYIDKKLVINADGLGWLRGGATVKLDRGIHSIRVSYMQGPRYHLYLMLSVAKPGEKARPFNTDDFRPPNDLADWTTEVPADLTEPLRRRLNDPAAPSNHAPATTLPRTPLRAPDPLVPLAVRVLSGGESVPGLTAADFLVRDIGQPQALAGVAYDSEPLDIELLIDSTPSLTAVLPQLSKAVRQAAGRLRHSDRVGVLYFAESLREALPLSSDRNALALSLRGSDLSPSGDRLQAAVNGDSDLHEMLQASTTVKELNTPIAAAAQLLAAKARPDARRGIVVLTDNRGVKGVSDRATRDALWRYNIIVCGLLTGNAPLADGAGDIRPLIQATGGETFSASAASVPLSEAVESIRSRYLLTYRPPAGQPKTIHPVSVELTPDAKARFPGAQLLVPGGYVVGEEGETPLATPAK